MIDKETYGLEIEAKTSKAKNSLKDLSNFIRNFGQRLELFKEGAKEEFDNQISNSINEFKSLFKETEEDINVDPQLFDTRFTKQIEYVKREMDAVKDIFEKVKSGDMPGDKLELQVKYEKLNNELNRLIERQEKFNNELEDTEEEATNTSSSLSVLFDKSIGKIKRFTYYLLGARSVFSLFMKYQSIYYQYNEQMQYQSELSQNAIALSLAPAFEFLGNMIAYASIGFAKFIELLTGVNVLSKVTTKGIRDYNKSLKESQSLASGIDEITNLTLPSGTGLADQYKALDDFQKKVAEVEKFFKENKWIESLANGLKKIWEYLKIGYDYIKEHWDIFKYIFGAVAITLIWQNPIGKIALITAGVGLLVDTYNKLTASKDKDKTATDKLYDSEKRLKDLREKKKSKEKEYIEAVDAQSEAQERLSKLLNEYKINLNDLIDGNGNAIKSYSDMSKEEKDVYKAHLDLTEATEHLNQVSLDYKGVIIDIGSEETKHAGSLMEMNKKYDETFTNLANKFRKGEIDAKTFTASVATYMEGMSEDYRKTFIWELPDDLKVAWKTAEDEIGNGLKVSQAFADGTSIKFSEFYNTVKKTTVNIGNLLDDTFKQRIINISMKYNIDKNSVLSLVNKVKGISNLMGVPSSTFDGIANKILKQFGYAKGLDYVPYDNYPALLHKGEAVVPAKYNPTIHSEGNEYTNSLLETLITKMDDLAKRPNILEIDGQQFANATYGLYEETANNQNYVKGVVK